MKWVRRQVHSIIYAIEGDVGSEREVNSDGYLSAFRDVWEVQNIARMYLHGR